jgi:adenine deaminase
MVAFIERLTVSPELVPQWDKVRKVARRDLIDVALGNVPADVCIRGGNLVNVLTSEIYPADVAILGDRIAAVGDVAYTIGSSTTIIDAPGEYITPGLIEAHHHGYHTHFATNDYIRLMLCHGVTSSAEEFYALGVIGGREAVRYFKDAFEASPLRLIFLVPTLAWIQNRDIGLTPAPGISASEMLEMVEWKGCRGLSETPFFSVVVKRYPEMLEVFDRALELGQVVSGHAADITERQLQAYIGLGAISDHESIEHHDGLAKARAGMRLWMREGSMGRNLAELVRTVTEHGIDTRTLAFSTDSAAATKLVAEGGIDEHVRVAIAHGMPPITAVQMATINTAEAFNLQSDIGCIAPGRHADILVVTSLVGFKIDRVIAGGRLVARRGEFLDKLPPPGYPADFYGTIKLATPITAEDLIPSVSTPSEVEVRVIGVRDGIIATEDRRARMTPANGVLAADPSRDILLVAMIDSHGKGTGVGLGFVQGFGLRAGAVAYHISTECASLCAVGADPADMAVAMNHVADMGGGVAIVNGGKLLASVELPVLRILSDEPSDTVMEKFARAIAVLAELGCTLAAPFSQIEFFFAGGNDGALRLSDEGLVLVTGDEVTRVPLLVG